MEYHKNAPWTAVSRERLARMLVHDGLTVGRAETRLSVSAETAAGRHRKDSKRDNFRGCFLIENILGRRSALWSHSQYRS